MSGGPHPRDTTKTAFVAALDATGKPLTTLTRADWGVREDGVDRPIVEAIRATEPVTYTRPDGATPKVLQMAVAHPGAQMLVPRTPPR